MHSKLKWLYTLPVSLFHTSQMISMENVLKKNLLYYLEVPKITDKMECKFSWLAYVGEVLKGRPNNKGELYSKIPCSPQAYIIMLWKYNTMYILHML